jgi:hypothetical protein
MITLIFKVKITHFYIFTCVRCNFCHKLSLYLMMFICRYKLYEYLFIFYPPELWNNFHMMVMKYDCVVFQLPASLVHAHVNLGRIKEYNTNSFSWLSYYEGIVQLTKTVIKTCNVRSHNSQCVSLHALIFFLYKPDGFSSSKTDTCSLLIVYKNKQLC